MPHPPLAQALRRGFLPVFALLALQSAAVVAQTPSPTTADGAVVLPAVSVTGAKRPQDPMSVDGTLETAEPEILRARGIASIDQLDRVFPDLHIRPRSARAYANLTMRGQTSSDFYSPSVLVLVDGLPQDFSLAGQLMPMQLERVEALYGPQGTLYGAGAVGGVLNIVTRRPDDLFRASAMAGISNRRREAGVLLNTPLVPGALFADLALQTRQELGRYQQMSGSDDVGGSRDYTGSLRLRYAPEGSPWDIMLSAARGIQRSTEEQYALANSRVALPFDSHYRLATTSLGLNASYDLGGMTIAWITGWQDRDFDRTIQGYYTPETQRTFSQELRLATTPGQGRAVDFVTGLYYQDVEFERRMPGQVSRQTLRSYAAYGEATWHITSRLDLTAGLRADTIDTTAEAHGFVPLRGSRNDSALSPKLSLGYRLTEALRLFALYSSGFKSGGFTRTVTPYNFAYDFARARTDNLEAGMRARLLDGRLEASASGYYAYTHGYQTFVGTQPVQYLQNVGDVESYGFDARLTAYATPALRLSAGLGLNHAEFVRYRDPTGQGQDNKGRRPAYAPAVTAQGEMAYTFALPRETGELVPHVGVTHVGRTWFDESNSVGQAAYTLLDAGISWNHPSGWGVHVYGANLTDKRYASYGFATGTPLGNAYQLGAGREVGFRVTASF
ncbi:TonB-dependent receptor [Roseomonas sp. 18066]|uniref:TonB-dependent receptor n=1 Tax=Roseomonas sp. 18066 TaxID=2681412 RepID=UPI00135712A5|nr:TonB-dependent receptor [Roseomonas sp. 18066]